MDDVQRLRDFYRGVHARGQRFATLLDGRGSSAPNAAIRKALADMANEFAEVDAKNMITVAMLLDSTVLVGVARAITWLLKTTSVPRCFTSPTDAFRFVSLNLEKEGLTMPAGTEAALEAMRASHVVGAGRSAP